MRIKCTINGKVVPPPKARIPVFDNSLFYAEGLFETFLAIDDKVIFLDEHLDRLEKGADLIKIKLPVKRSTIKQWIETTNRSHESAIKKIRATITAGDSSFWAGKPSLPRIIIIVTDYEIPTKPWRIGVSPYKVDQSSPFRNVKTLSFIIEMTSRKLAYSEGLNDHILLNRMGNVAETTSANIFWVRNGKLFTPPLSAGCLDGMTRRHILQLAKADGLPASEENTTLRNLLKADEIFITSSIKLVIPVIHIKTDKIYRYPIGEITKRLRKLCWNYIKTGGE